MKKRVLIALIVIFSLSLFSGMLLTLIQPAKYANMLCTDSEETEDLESEKFSNEYFEYSQSEHSGLIIESVKISPRQKDVNILGHLRHCPETPPPNVY